MARYKGRNYFLVRHDLESFKRIPGCIWNSEQSSKTPPVGFRQVQAGDAWIAFAYTTSGKREKTVSLITGFYKCTDRKPRYRKLPPSIAALSHSGHAWMIKGKNFGAPIGDAVVIPPLSNFLGNRLFNQRTITRISEAQFQAIQSYTRKNRFSTQGIPCLMREPTNEQEVLAIVANSPARIGIAQIIRARTRFPDLQVKLLRKSEPVHLELELYSSSFLNHGHERQVKQSRFVGTRQTKGDRRPVGVLCWVDDAKGDAVSRHVHRVYELRSLLKDKQRIRW